jgi:hypothetical protein
VAATSGLLRLKGCDRFASGAAIHEHDEPFTGPELGILDGFLDWHRATLLWK